MAAVYAGYKIETFIIGRENDLRYVLKYIYPWVLTSCQLYISVLV